MTAQARWMLLMNNHMRNEKPSPHDDRARTAKLVGVYKWHTGEATVSAPTETLCCYGRSLFKGLNLAINQFNAQNLLLQ